MGVGRRLGGGAAAGGGGGWGRVGAAEPPSQQAPGTTLLPPLPSLPRPPLPPARMHAGGTALSMNWKEVKEKQYTPGGDADPDTHTAG